MEDLRKRVFSNLLFEVVAYDEIETFKDADYNENNVSYQYPFGARKSRLASLSFDPIDGGDYAYKIEHIKFQRSTVCLDAPFYNDVLSIIPSGDDSSCDGAYYEKIKYSTNSENLKFYMEDYA